MIVVVLTAIGVASALTSWERIKRLARLPIRHLWLVWVALGVQLVLFEYAARHIPESWSNAIHLATYGLSICFIVLNRHLPGATVIALGTAANLIAIVANGGSMPADMDAWRKAGLREIPPEVFENSAALSNPRLGFLGDIFYVPADWPLSNVFSIGDVLIVIGGTWLAHRWCSRRADGEIRTLTDGDLNAVPLPVGLRRPDGTGYAAEVPPDTGHDPYRSVRSGGSAGVEVFDGLPSLGAPTLPDPATGRVPSRSTPAPIALERVTIVDPGARRRSIAVTLVTFLLALIGVGMASLVIVTDVTAREPGVDWPIVAVAALLLLLGERTPTTWIRFGSLGVVTPIWMLSYAILLLGAPSVAVVSAVLGAVVHLRTEPESRAVGTRSVASAAISVSAAGLAMRAVGASGPITQFDRLPWDWAIAVALTGSILLVVNSVISAVSVSLPGRLSFVSLLRRGMHVRLTAEGALLSLAPIWVLGIHSSLVLAPLLAMTTVLVFRSTRQALERYHEAHHDPLTGLLNRRGFLDELDGALSDPRAGTRTNVLIMDLNGFKEVNDRLGHQIGDSLLVEYGARLDQSRPDGSIAARLGGDEFALLLVGDLADDDLEQMVAQLHARLASPLVVEGFPISIGVSIGIAVSPADGHTTRDLLRAADVAMYKAKRTSVALERYSNCVPGPQRGRLNLLGDLGDALTNHQLHIQFQPQLRIVDGVVDTVEALIRWQHPDHGSIPPSEFIGLAEQTDLIGPITEMVLRAATTGLLAAGHDDVRLAVNVSARSIQDRYFASQVLSMLAQTGFPPERLELEVTERAIVSHAERSTYTIDQLRHAGVRIAIDDFGVGYASFRTLRLIDVDRVKLDRDFVGGILTEPRDRLIVSSLIQLAHQLDLDVVAEGVESTAVWDELARLGCDVAQGFGIAVPMRFSELRTWLSAWNELVIERHGADVEAHGDGRGRDRRVTAT